jgi:spore germination cell wall hydrolase CwlJ-like protein
MAGRRAKVVAASVAIVREQRVRGALRFQAPNYVRTMWINDGFPDNLS